MAEEDQNPYLPPGPKPLVFEDFAGINTQTVRAGVPDKQMAWCDGFMPIEPRNLRTLYGIGAALYTATGGLTIICFFFYNIGSVSYCAVFLSDGSVVQVQVSNSAATQIGAASTISLPSILNVGFRQYGNQYLLFVANQTNGYFIWDGTLLYKAGTLGPVVTLTNTGSAYKTVPVVVATGGSGHGATFVATIAGGQVVNVTVTNPGSGYLPGQTVTLAFHGGNSGGTGGVLTANLANTGSGSGAAFSTLTPGSGFSQLPNGQFAVTSVNITNGGAGYSQFTTLTLNITGAISITQQPVLQPVISGGVIIGVTIVVPGEVIERSIGSLSATITASDAGAFFVSSVTINNGGSGYSASATAVCSGGGTPISQAVLQLVLTNGVITGVTVASGGLYGSNTAPTVTVADAPVNAAATVALMPFGVQGTDVETYTGHVWVISGPEVNATAPGSVTDFATSDGGVSFESNNSNLRIGYTRLLSTNGFLYLIGDSAVDYISGVTTAGTPPTTTFTYQDVDPEVGTPYPASVLTFGNAFLYANSVGIQLCVGATVEKISDDLDGSGMQPNGTLWDSVANFGGNQLSSAKATIFNKKVAMVLATVLDPISAIQVNKLFMWNGRYWWASQQDVTLTYITTLEINSNLTAYGTDGTHIYPLFQTPSTGFTKTVQSRLWDAPGGYVFTKAATRLWGLTQYYSMSSPTVTVSVDNENGSMASPYSLTPTGLGYFVWSPEAVAQQGVLTGLTIKTSSADMSLVSVALGEDLVQYRG